MGLMDRDYMHERWRENDSPTKPPKLGETVFRETRSSGPSSQDSQVMRYKNIAVFRIAVFLWLLSVAAYLYVANQRAMALPKQFAKYILTPRERFLLLSEDAVSWIDVAVFSGRIGQKELFEYQLFLSWVVLLSIVCVAIGLMCFQMAARSLFVVTGILLLAFAAIHSTPLVSYMEIFAIAANAVLFGYIVSRMYIGAVDLKFQGWAIR